MKPSSGRSHSGTSRDRWLLSYADFMTLLFALFTTMYAMSRVDDGKYLKVAAGLHEALNPKDTVPLKAGVLPGGQALMVQDQNNARSMIERDMAEELRSGRVELLEDARGLVLSIPEASAFAPGSADLSDIAKEAVTRLANSIRETSSGLLIEGHTDDTPMHSVRFASNWELSTARAIAVVQWLVEHDQFPPNRLSAAGYGEYRPRVPNDSPLTRARNRRVDIVIQNTQKR
ncbi:MAG: flagellar motor protein MotB [Vicinamibacterales bacterium]